MNPTLLHHLLDARAAERPERPALTRAGATWTYGELRQASLRAAQELALRDVRAGDRVLVFGAHAPQTVAALYGVSRVGACAVIVNEQSTDYQVGHVVRDCAPRFVIADPAGPGDRPALAGLPVLPAGALDPGGAPVDEAVLPDQPCLSVDPITLIYTSGSTALPKAVVSTHGQVLFAARAIAERLRYRPDDVIFCCLPLAFDYGLYQAHLASLAGAQLVLGDAGDAGPTLLSALHECAATVLPLVPSLAATLVRMIDRTGEPPRTLRMVTNTGAALPDAMAARLRDRIPGLRVVTMFGLTECKRVSISDPDEAAGRPGSVGRALPDTEFYVVDADGRRLPPGEVGELVVRGPHVMAGYWNAPELTARRFRRDELGRTLLYTGDRCRVDADGHLYFAGRDDDVYKQQGMRVSATEVEAAAMDIPGVELAVVLLRPTADAAVEAQLVVGGDITEERLVKELRARLDGHKIPPRCRRLAALPLTANGKIDRPAVRRVLEES